ncbi:hypothetical protein BDR03DRAFT_809887, partial [Suillus americanus]
HDHATTSHPGHFKTKELIKCNFWWPSMGTYIPSPLSTGLDSCALCQQMKSDTHPMTSPLTPILPSIATPFAQVSVDLITDFPLCDGFDSIIDHGIMKEVILILCTKAITSEGVAKKFFKYIYRHFGLHEKVILD